MQKHKKPCRQKHASQLTTFQFYPGTGIFCHMRKFVDLKKSVC